MDFIDRRRERLALIADELVPKVVPSNWRAHLSPAPAFAGRATRSLFAIFLRQALRCHAFTLLRSLYEHLARFAWIAVEPPAHIEVWLKWDRKERITRPNS
jgi:hypothetical protein